ncbi:MAG: GIY-YIG nuclease family protein [bacterium]|nr:GIY-YIG nuclease family protein [bacterium]
MKSFHVYILKCNDDSYYIGHTDDIERRVSEHEQGLISGYTSTRLPVKVVFVEEFGTRAEAIDAERKLKGWSRKKKETLIKYGWQAMKGFCRRNKK